ncbi:MAG: hypothetical protein KIT84_04155 [Labilithrix sp.]|nr:hypothetical protein [Labilithrix sp.]MCW5810179.1 hypothetical protein [Labilithrix sp.]
MTRRWVLGLVVACGAPAAAATTTPAHDPAAPAKPGAAAAGPAAAPDAGRGIVFVRGVPRVDERRSIDACVYPSALGSACIDALLREPDAVRATYMRRVSDAYARLGRGPKVTAATHAEIAECCHRDGPCGAPKRTGHADCPIMDDGYACLTAAEILRAEKAEKKGATALHARACRCSPERAQIAAPGGTLACDGPNRPTERAGVMSDREATQVIACATCDPTTGPAACAAERDRLEPNDPALAHLVEAFVTTRCQEP